MKHLLQIILIVIFSTQAQAQKSEFETTVSAAQINCPTLRCDNQKVHLENLSFDGLKDLGSQGMKSIRAAMDEVSQIWGDTIEEGGIVVQGNLKLEKLEKVLSGDTVIGYRFTFSSAAYNSEEGNLKGALIDHGFVSSDFQSAFRDEKNLVIFKPLDH